MCRVAALLLVVSVLARAEERVLFEEHFDDSDWESRGWYDGPRFETTDAERVGDSGRSCVWHWRKKGDISPSGGGARARIAPVTSVTLSYAIKHSANWAWTGVDWHPHEFHFITDADEPFVGPAYTHLTFYCEVVNGVPRVAIQDGRNVDESRRGQNLSGVTENRAVAGCNGDSDGHGDGDCYRSGERWVNGKSWEPTPKRVYFGDMPGAFYKGDWHRVRANFRLNSVVNGVGQRDGVLQYWLDGVLLMDYHDVVFRTGQHPNMRINQFLMTPYFGPGVPHEQTIWVDDIKITTDEPLNATKGE